MQYPESISSEELTQLDHVDFTGPIVVVSDLDEDFAEAILKPNLVLPPVPRAIMSLCCSFRAGTKLIFSESISSVCLLHWPQFFLTAIS